MSHGSLTGQVSHQLQHQHSTETSNETLLIQDRNALEKALREINERLARLELSRGAPVRGLSNHSPQRLSPLPISTHSYSGDIYRTNRQPSDGVSPVHRHNLSDSQSHGNFVQRNPMHRHAYDESVNSRRRDGVLDSPLFNYRLNRSQSNSLLSVSSSDLPPLIEPYRRDRRADEFERHHQTEYGNSARSRSVGAYTQAAYPGHYQPHSFIPYNPDRYVPSRYSGERSTRNRGGRGNYSGDEAGSYGDSDSGSDHVFREDGHFEGSLSSDSDSYSEDDSDEDSDTGHYYPNERYKYQPNPRNI